MNNNIMVSILCTAYNHEKYIRQCLNGFMMQKTSFSFEVIVHDDASTDHTADIIREYEKKYPDIIKPIYQTENQFSKKIGIWKTFMIPKSKGKYLAVCEGDDFWTDEYKLQKQVDALENNSNCKMCVCTVRDANEDGSFLNTTHPSDLLDNSILGTEDFLRLATKEYAFQTSSFFYKREDYLTYINDKPEYARISPVGDWPELLYFCTVGDIYYIRDEMSCYRRNAVESYTTSMGYSDTAKKKKYYKGLVNMINSFDKCTKYNYHNSCSVFSRRFMSYYYNCLLEERNFNEVLQKEYREFFKKESKRDKMYIRLSVYCPFLIKIYNKTKNK